MSEKRIGNLKRSIECLALGLALLALAACAGLSARGSVEGQAIQTRVDSEVARYYLENYLAGKHADAELDARIDRVYQTANGSLPDRDELKELSDEFSVDFAALYFADRIALAPANRRFRSVYDRNYESTRKALAEGPAQLPAAAADYAALIVPSYLYKRNMATGAALAAPREALQKVGLPCYFVETVDDGTVESNAELVMAAIRARAEDGRRLILISASKSGPEVALALTKLGAAETRHVSAWINAVGALQGTPLIEDNVLPELEYIVGKVDPAGAASIMTAASRRRFESFHLPEDILVVNLIGIPTSGSVGFRAGRGYFPMRKHGPNDGMVLLADTIYPRGVTVAELGSDHFLMYNLDVISIALVKTVIDWLENPGGTVTARP
ncbi:MAG TPA: hypothetical protein VL754_10200 [Verrucomicrobiae bacterium]|nr:hypothetical protein [Verrucomicrobiae bacterium]